MSVKFDFSTLETGFEALWPVEVKVPQDGGTFQTQTFTARLRHVPVEELQAVLDKAKAEPSDEIDVISIPALYFVGLGPDEKATWSPELRDKMLRRRFVREGLERAYHHFSTGEAARGN